MPSGQEKPVKGERYRCQPFRGVWTVRSAGEKFVTLAPNIPWLKPKRIPTAEFLAQPWKPCP